MEEKRQLRINHILAGSLYEVRYGRVSTRQRLTLGSPTFSRSINILAANHNPSAL